MNQGNWYWLSTDRMTIAVLERERIIVVAPPIARKFIGQPTESLMAWMARQSGFRYASLGAL